MNFTYENQGSNTFMVYEVGADEVIDSMSLGMITNNKILGLAPTIFFQQDTTKYFKYNISAKVSADQFLMGVVNKKRLIGVFQGIVNAMLSAEEYMIDANSICLDLQYIFTDVSTCETVLVCLPIVDLEKPPVDLKLFFKNIVFGTQFDQTENCDYVAKLFNHLNSASVFSLLDFKELLDEIERGNVPVAPQVAQPVPVQQPVSQRTSAQPTVQHTTPVQSTPQAPPTPVQPAKPVVPAPAPVAKPEIIANSKADVGFAILGQKSTAVVPKEENSINGDVATDEKGMSLVYLMRNYSKENAALYKAQQEAKKAAKASASPAKEEKKKDKKEKTPKATSASSISNAGFAIPGQSVEAPKPVTPSPVAVPTPEPVSPTPQPAAYTAPQPETYAAPQPTSAPVASPTGMTANFGETTVLSSAGIGETTVLNASPMMQEVKPYLIRSKNNEKIILDKPVFRIGKEKSYVDYFIGDNTAISRSHANIVQRDGEYFVMDTNSTNHTYVNGGMIQSNVETKIFHGAMIRLANEDFEFKLY